MAQMHFYYYLPQQGQSQIDFFKYFDLVTLSYFATLSDYYQNYRHQKYQATLVKSKEPLNLEQEEIKSEFKLIENLKPMLDFITVNQYEFDFHTDLLNIIMEPYYPCSMEAILHSDFELLAASPTTSEN